MKDSPSLHHGRSHQQLWPTSEVHLLSPESVPVQAEDLDEQHSSLPEPNEGHDGMGNTGIAGKCFATGTSSTASFMKQIRDAVSAKLSIPAEVASRGASNNVGPFHSSSKDPNSWFLPRLVAEHCVLPARNSADRMLDVYWEQVHIVPLSPSSAVPAGLRELMEFEWPQSRQQNGLLYLKRHIRHLLSGH
jgi:hypothetical protein